MEKKRDIDKVLIIDDDPRMRKVLHRLFTSEGYQVLTAVNGREGMEQFHTYRPLAVVLDLMLPEISGRDVCKQLKAISPGMPVIVLSAVTEVADKVLLLEIGADDYVTKPFSPRELLARMQAAVRRTQAPTQSLVHFGDCEVDRVRMTVTKNKDTVVMTAHELKLLLYFLDHAERVLTREELLNDVWGYSFYTTTRTVDNQILKLRQKLETDPAKPEHFMTMHGMGYKFIP